MARRLRRTSCMDPRLRERMIGGCFMRLPKPTLADRDGDEAPDPTAHTERDTSLEGEIHPEVFGDEASRLRLGLDAIHAE